MMDKRQDDDWNTSVKEQKYGWKSKERQENDEK